MLEITIGVISGLVTAFIILGLKMAWSDYLKPFWKTMTYSGVQISGFWTHHNDNSAVIIGPEDPPLEQFVSDGKLNLTQKAYSLGGSFVYYYKDGNREFTLDFDVHGQLWEGYITLRFTPTDKRILSYATGMFKICGGGTHMEGQFVFRNVDNEKVDNIYMAIVRKDEILNR